MLGKQERIGPEKLTVTSHLFAALGEGWVGAEGQSQGAAERWPQHSLCSLQVPCRFETLSFHRHF